MRALIGSTAKDADLQMRERFEKLFDGVEAKTLYGIGALGTKLCIYTANRETGRLLPKRVPADPGFVTGTAPINRWGTTTWTSNGNQNNVCSIIEVSLLQAIPIKRVLLILIKGCGRIGPVARVNGSEEHHGKQWMELIGRC